MRVRFLIPLLLLTAAPLGAAGANQAVFAPEASDSSVAGANFAVFAPPASDSTVAGANSAVFAPPASDSTVAGANQAAFAPQTPDSTLAGAKQPVFAPESPETPEPPEAFAPPVIHPDEAFRPRQLIVPGVLLAGGLTGVYSPWYKEKVNIPVRNYALELSGGRQLHFDDYIQYLPVASFAGLGFAVPSEHGFAERVCITATAYATQGILTNALKYSIKEPRPDSDARNAFPSGHSATAFMGAELVRKEYGPWWGAGAYAVATATALMRIYNDRHWTNDLLGGAAIGILSADIGFWLLPLERRLFGLDGSGKALAVLPTPYGLSLACVF